MRRKRKNPGARGSGVALSDEKPPSDARAVADQVGVVGVFGDLPPQILVVAERQGRLPDLLEIGIRGRNLVVKFERGLQAGIHHAWRKRAQLRASRYQPLERGR